MVRMADKDGRNLFDPIFQDSMSMRAPNRNPLSRWKLLQEGKDGETPDIMKIGLDQAGRLKPSLSDIVAHCSFLHLRIGLDCIL